MQKQNSLAKRAYLLHLNSLTIANGMKSGSFKSLYKGQGIDFSGVRDYLSGDDVRTIDWNVTSRMAKPYVKVFEEDKELDVFIILDKSLSMETGSIRTRMDCAVECASLLSMAASIISSPTGAVLFSSEIEFSCTPATGKKHLYSLLSRYEKQLNTKQKGSALDSALIVAEKLLRKRSLVIIISDFRSKGWERPFASLCHKNDVIALRITDSSDTILPVLGSVTFTDPETSFSESLPTHSKKFARAWREYNEQKTDAWTHECLRRGAFPFTLNTASDAATELCKLFYKRGAS